MDNCSVIFFSCRISRPPVIRQQGAGRAGQCNGGHPVFFGKITGKFPEQQVNIFLSLSQSGNTDGNSIQTVIQIFTEPIPLCTAFSISTLVAAIRRTSVFWAWEEPTRMNSPVSKTPKQPHLGGQWKLNHFIQENGSLRWPLQNIPFGCRSHRK